ncbi:EamA family transporter [Candidatus Woesearchaeota archaeon]|nr:EamA family transporter [Candidatus Woesearchaeota archaeon]
MNKKGLILAFTTAIISGFSIYLNKFGVTGIESSIFTFSKNIIVALFLFSTVLLFKENLNLKLKQWIKLIMIGLIGGSIPFLLFFKGLQLTSSASAAFIHKTMFVYVALLAVLFLREKITKKFLAGSILLLMGNAIFLKVYYPIFDKGALYIFIATLLWAIENIISKHTLKELSSRVVAFGRMFFGSSFILVYLIFSEKIVLLNTLNLNQIGWVLVTTIPLFLYQITWYESLKYLKASTATSVLLLGSMITSLLDLNFTLRSVAGSLLIILGLILTTRLFSVIKVLSMERLTFLKKG